MKIPFKPSLLKVRRQPVKFIILHHTAEIYKNPNTNIDNSNYQFKSLSNEVLLRKDADLNYHYIIEKVKDDFIPVVCRPIAFLCEWDDISKDINNRALHVALLGNYDLKIPEPRLYQVLAYRVLNPMLKLFGLSTSRIKMHNEVSEDEDLSCPGEFVEKDIVISMTRRFVIK